MVIDAWYISVPIHKFDDDNTTLHKCWKLLM